MQKKAPTQGYKNSKIFVSSSDLKGDKKESKMNSFLSLNFYQSENGRKSKTGILTKEKTIITNEEININTFSLSFLSFNENIPEEGNEDDVINNFNVDNYSMNVISRK